MKSINYPIIIAILFLASLIIGLAVLLPKYQDLSATSASVKIEREKVKIEKEYYSSVLSISEELKDYETELSKIGSSLPEDASLPSLLNFLEKAVSQAGLIIDSISPSSSSPSPDLKNVREVRVSMTVSGDYSAFKNLVSILERSSRLIEVENISFSHQRPSDNEYNLRIKAYSY